MVDKYKKSQVSFIEDENLLQAMSDEDEFESESERNKEEIKEEKKER